MARFSLSNSLNSGYGSGSNYGSGFSFGGRSSGGSGNNIDYQQLAKSIGIDPKQEQNKPSFLENLFNILGRPQQTLFGGISAAESGQNPLEGAWKGLSGQSHTSFSDILQKAGMGNQNLFTVPILNKTVGTRDIAGLAGDLVLDPLNLVGVGEGAAALKGFKLGDTAVTLGKAGAKALEAEKAAQMADATAKGVQLTGDALDNAARDSLAQKMLANPALQSKYIDKGGLKIAGKSVLPQQTITNAADRLEQVPIAGIPVKTARGVKSVADSAFNLFQQGYKAKQAGGEPVVNEIQLLKSRLSNAFSDANNAGLQLDKAIAKAKPAGLSKEDATRLFFQHRESPTGTTPQWLQPIIDTFGQKMDAQHAAEAKIRELTGTGDAYRANYVSHAATNFTDPEAAKTVAEKLFNEQRTNPLKIGAGYTNARSNELTINQMIDEGKKMGIDLVPKSPGTVLANRIKQGQQDLAKFDAETTLQSLGKKAYEAPPDSIASKISAIAQNTQNQAKAQMAADLASKAAPAAREIGKNLSVAKGALDQAIVSNASRAEIDNLRTQVSKLSQDYAHAKGLEAAGAQAAAKAPATAPAGVSDLFSQATQNAGNAAQNAEHNLFNGVPQTNLDNLASMNEKDYQAYQDAQRAAMDEQLHKAATQQDFLNAAKADNVPGAAEAHQTAQRLAEQTTPNLEGYVSVPNVKELEGFVFPKEVAQFISDSLGETYKPKGDIMKALDTFAQIWKGSVTTLPTSAIAFNVRNKIGNMFNMYLAGVDNFHDIKQAANTSATVAKDIAKNKLASGGVTDKFGVFHSYQDLIKDGVMGGQAEREVGKVSDTLAGKAMQKTGAAVDKLFVPGQKLGQFVEAPDRVALYIHGIDKGMTNSEAVAYVNKFLFDYANPTKTVKNIGKAVPFFTWIANNVPLQVERLLKTPGKYSHLRALYQNGISQDDRNKLPSYVNEGMTINGGQKTDSKGNVIQTVLTNLGLPAEDLSRLNRGGVGRTVEREVLGALMPVLQEPLQEATGRDFFRGKSLQDLATTYGFAARDYPQFIKNMIGYKETPYTDKNGQQKIEYSVNPQAYLRLTELTPFSRALSTLFPSSNAGQSVPQQALSVLEKGASPVSINDYNLTTGEAQNQKEALQRIQQRLVDAGKLRQFTDYYIPKDQKAQNGRFSLSSSLKKRP